MFSLKVKKRFVRKKVTLKKRWLKNELLMNILDDSAWLCMEKLKKHSFETHKPKILSKILKESKHKRKEIAFIGAFEVPRTLP